MSTFRTIEVSDPRFEHDGLRLVTFKSRALGGRMDQTMFGRPTPPDAVRERPTPLVILLHGVYGSHWAWSLKGGAHRTAARLIDDGSIPPMVLAMPSDGLWGDGSGYVRHMPPAAATTIEDSHAPTRDGPGTVVRAPDFERYILDEVPAAAAEAFPEINPSSPIFIAGLSMGGFGALKLGAKHPRRYAGVSAHSAITHFSQMSRFVEEPLTAYGPLPEDEQSVLHWMTLNRATLPPLRFDCGTDDPLLDANRQLHRELDALAIPHAYAQFPGGHEWPYWECRLEDTLRFFAAVLRDEPRG